MMIMRAGWIDMRGDHSGWRGGKGKGTPGAWKAKRERGKKMNILSTKVNKPGDELCIMNNVRRTIQDEYTKYQSKQARWWIMHNE